MTDPARPQEDRPLQRYDLVTNYRAGSSIEEMERADDGEWVRFDDVAHLAAQAARPRQELDESRSPDGDGPIAKVGDVKTGGKAHAQIGASQVPVTRRETAEAGSEPADSHTAALTTSLRALVAQPEDLKQAFEHWMRVNNPHNILARADPNDPYDYVNAFTEAIWEGWRGAMADLAARLPSEDV